MAKSFEEIYVDGIEEINIADGNVKIDFMTIQPSGDPKNPERETKCSIQIPLDKIVDTYMKLGKLGGVLAENGIIGVRKAEDGKGIADFKKPN